VVEHNRLAKKEFAKIKNLFLSKDITKISLPQLPTNLRRWVDEARPVVEGKKRSFLAAPFWEQIYMDEYPFKMIVGGRQTFKSTYITDLLACKTTSTAGSQVCYVTFSQQSQTAFSRQKLQRGTFGQNPILRQFPRNKLGNAGEISLKNDSTIYCTQDSNNYKNVEGKSLDLCVLDEAQYQRIEEAQRVVQTMMATKGHLVISGIGGEAGSPYETLWKMSDQREWVSDDPNWRDRLRFDEHGFVIDEYLKNVLPGQWIPQNPDNAIFHGYHIPQPLFPTIPMTIADAVEKYKINPMFSIEYQQKNNPASIFTTNSLAEFYKAANRPVTEKMILACMTPYRYLELLKPYEIAELKETYQNKIRVSMGVDFGSGNPAKTVIAVVIEWRNEYGQSRYHLAYLEKRPAENQLDQAEYICELFKRANCDIGLGDLGYGANQVKVIQDGGHNRHNSTPFYGVGTGKFRGCRTIGDETKPVQVFDETTDEHGDKTGRVNIDKTTALQGFIDMLEVQIPHPARTAENDLKRPQLMIPYAIEHQVDWLIKDFTNITRKDLLQTQGSAIDPRQRAKKEFNHPKDSVMAIIYAKTALELDFEWAYV